jgi:hypothetical protein
MLLVRAAASSIGPQSRSGHALFLSCLLLPFLLSAVATRSIAASRKKRRGEPTVHPITNDTSLRPYLSHYPPNSMDNHPSRSNSPQITTIPMDLGLELNRAPTGMKGEAVIGFSELNVRSKQREEAEMKEFG